jgi:DNA-binding beta-propeller fold protein YncE
MEQVTHPPMTRRAWLLASTAALSCGRKRATGFPGYCFVADQADRSVIAVDLQRFRIAKRIPLDAAPTALAVSANPARPRVCALAPEGGVVYEIDAAGLAVERRSSAGSQAVAMRFAPTGTLWVLYREPAMLASSPLDNFRLARRVMLPAPPDSFDLSADGRAAVASRQNRGVSIVSLSRGAVERTIATGVEPSLVQFRQDGRHLLVGSAPDRCLAIFDVATGKTVVRLPLPIAPRHFAVTSDGGQLFISGDGADLVSIVFPYSTEVDRSILAGHAPGAMVVTDTSPSYLMVANPESGGVTILDVDMRRLVATARVGEGPMDILITPDYQYALVLGQVSADLAVIRLATLAEDQAHRFKTAPLFTLLPLGGKPVAAAIVQTAA